MKIIDTFLFSEPHEDDLLWVKLNIQDGHVDEHIIIENAYTHQGAYKGLYANEVLKQDRFKPFLSKIAVVSAEHLHSPGVNLEKVNFEREIIQRAYPFDYLYNKYGNSNEQVRVMFTDVDECIDFSDEKRREVFISNCESFPNEPISFARLRYWYDYDNKSFLPQLRIPTIPFHLIVQNRQLMSYSRVFVNEYKHFGDINNPVGFEYSYVFRSFEDVCRKKHTYHHTGFDDESVAIGLECNHWPRPESRNEKLGNEAYDFFEFVELTPENSPKFVRENLSTLKTNIVNKDYKTKRVERYGVANIEEWTKNREN